MIRTKAYITGDYVDIEVFNLSSHRKPFKRQRKIKESRPAQKKLNDRKSKQYLVRLANLNFRKKDLAVDLTFDDEHLPKDRKGVRREVKNYIKRLQRIREKEGLEPLKYIYIISNTGKEGEEVRWHVHMIVNRMDRDIAEEKWGRGMANANRLQFSDTGLAGRVIYMVRQAKGERTWTASKNLKRPVAIVSDHKVKRRDAEYMAINPDDRQFIERLINKGRKEPWIFTDCIVFNDGRQQEFKNLDPKAEWSGGISLMIRARRLAN